MGINQRGSEIGDFSGGKKKWVRLDGLTVKRR